MGCSTLKNDNEENNLLDRNISPFGMMQAD